MPWLMTCLIVLFGCLLPLQARGEVGNTGSWGDQGDGTYINPILPGDFSDPDVIRVDDDYYLITSTFQYSPGMAILHSRDMVNWQHVGGCIPDLRAIGPDLNWDRMNRYNRGIYAGALRYHGGKFWMFMTTMDEGVFMMTAADVKGPWSPLHRVSDMKGWDDPCPLWDDDGKAYLLLSRPGKEWWTYLFKMTRDGKSIDVDSKVVVDNAHGSEGNKIYKIGGVYYIFHNQIDGPGNRTGVMMRAKSLAGPWEKKLILHGTTPDRDREPNQGALVEAKDGSWWFFTHQGRGGFYEGRPTNLLPVTWVDGWPMPGEVDAEGIGTMVWRHKKPIEAGPPALPQSSDDFGSDRISPQWEWNYQPREGMWSLTDRPGHLRLKAFKPLAKENFLKVGNTLSQRVMGYLGGEVTVKLDVAGMADGQQAGLALYADTYALLGVRQVLGRREIYLTQKSRVRNAETRKDEDQFTTDEGPGLSGTEVYLRSVINPEGLAQAQYSLDGTTFTPIGKPYPLRWANYRGARLGLYSFNEAAEAGWVDVDSVKYVYRNK